MLALHEYRRMICGGCGGWMADTTLDVPYVVPPPVRCHRCTAISAAQEQHAKDHSHMHATRWTAQPRG